MAAEHDIDIDRGSVFTFYVGYEADGELVDLTGHTAEFVLSGRRDSETIVTLTEEDDITFGEFNGIGGEDFNIRVTLDASATAALDAAYAFYRLTVVPGGEPENAVRVLQGRAEIG